MQTKLTELFARVKPRKVVETGTHTGTGTTTMLYNAAKANGLDTAIITLECNPDYYRQACNYFWDSQMNLIQPRMGLSLPRRMLPTLADVQHEYVDKADTKNGAIYYDHNPLSRAALYVAETNHPTVEEDCLNKIIHEGSTPVDIFLLDSAGHVGQAEFHYLLGLLLAEPQLATKPFYVVLDDTRHCKHVKTLEFIKANPSWKVLVDSPDRFGWAIAEITLPN